MKKWKKKGDNQRHTLWMLAGWLSVSCGSADLFLAAGLSERLPELEAGFMSLVWSSLEA